MVGIGIYYRLYVAFVDLWLLYMHCADMIADTEKNYTCRVCVCDVMVAAL